MADSSVAITAGLGTNIDTRTESVNGDHRQVIVIGDPATGAGVAPVDVTKGLKVNIGTDNAVAAAGDVAAAATDSGNPVKIGGVAHTANPTAVTDGQRANIETDKLGRQVVVPHQIRDLAGDQTTTISASTSETTIATAVASTFLDLVSLMISNTSATPVRVDIRDTTGGSVRFSIYVPASDVRGIVFSVPCKQATVNTNWTAQSSASVTDLRVFAQFVKNI